VSDPLQVIGEARGDYLQGMIAQGYRTETMVRLMQEYDDALEELTDALVERDRLMREVRALWYSSLGLGAAELPVPPLPPPPSVREPSGSYVRRALGLVSDEEAV